MRRTKVCFYGLICTACMILALYAWQYDLKPAIWNKKNKEGPDVLLIYIYGESHPYSLGNLKYFIDTAVRGTDPVDYYFILQQNNNTNINENKLPKLPNNAHYIHHENKCFDYGTAGWFLFEFTTGNPYRNKTLAKNGEKIDLKKYKYFIFMNSSTRGPYLPPYYYTLVSLYESRVGKKYYWYSLFTERITDTVKLVGPIISCEVSPHVQSYIVATDFVGLSVLLETKEAHGVFYCHSNFAEAIRFGEIGFTKTILAAGYMVDCLMTKYQKLDFSAPKNRHCNSESNPHVNNGVDGISLDPYEIVFIKFNYKRNDGIAADRAQIYQKWVRELQNNKAKYS